MTLCARLLGVVLWTLQVALVGSATPKALPDKDYSFYGKAMHKDMPILYDDVVRKCFQGFGFVHCQNLGAPPELANSGFHWRSAVRPGAEFCLECCNNVRLERTFSEMWNLACDISKGGSDTRRQIETDPYSYEFRFARRDFLGDKAVVRCPITRPREVWTARVFEPGPGPITGYFQLRVGGAAGTRTPAIQRNALAMRWEEMRLTATAGTGLDESVQAKIFAAAGAVDVSRTETVPSRGPASGYTWSVTFPSGEFPSNAPAFDSVTNPYMSGVPRFSSPNTTLTVARAPRMVMSGYRLTMEVRERHDGIKFWRSVRSCYVNTTERAETPAMFEESFRVQFSAAGRGAGGGGGAVWRALCTAAMAVLLVAVYAHQI